MKIINHVKVIRCSCGKWKIWKSCLKFNDLPFKYCVVSISKEHWLLSRILLSIMQMVSNYFFSARWKSIVNLLVKQCCIICFGAWAPLWSIVSAVYRAKL